MSLNLVLYAFSKKQNSTAIPTQGSGTVVPVTLKQETSLNNPVFVLSGDLPVANYCQFESAFYFIDDITSVRTNLWEIACTLDALATYRAAIRSTSAFVEYSSQGYSDLSDTRIAPRENVSLKATVLGGGNVLGISETGTYLLSAVGSAGVNTYVCSAQNLRDVLLSIGQWADGIWTSGMAVGEALVEYFKNAIAASSAADAITDCRWLPFVSNGFQVSGYSNIFLGRYDTGVNVGILDGAINNAGGAAIAGNIPFTRSGFLRLKPYSEVYLYIPFVGIVSLETPLFTSSAAVSVNFSINERSGEISYSVSVGGQIVGNYSASTAAAVPVGVSNINPMNFVNSVTSGALAASYGNVIGAAGSALNALTLTNVTNGGISGSGAAGLLKEFTIYLIEHEVSGAVGNMAAVQGLPLFATRTLSSLSGYVKTRGASVSGNMRGTLRDMINNMLDSGIFLE